MGLLSARASQLNRSVLSARLRIQLRSNELILPELGVA